LTIDPTPTQGSTNAVSSGGVYDALDGLPKTVTPTETDADFYLSDENGNVLLELADGHIKTKEFDSANIDTDADIKAHGSNANDVDLDFADSHGHVLMRIKDGHIQTAGFDSSAIDGTPDFEKYTSDTVTATSGTGVTLTVVHNFKKGDRIACHINDGVAHDNYGNYASWYEGSTLIASRRRGNNGYFERTVKADCASISAVIGADEYEAGTSLQLVVYILHRPVQPKIVTVAQDGTGMYTLLKDAVESITDANHVTNPYIIEVYPGIYDTLEGYDDETIAEAGTSTVSGAVFQGLKLTNGMSIRGAGGNREEIVLTATLDPTKWSQAVRSMISALNIQGTGGIENLTIDAHNMRYCVHDDFTTPANERRLRTLKNVRFTGSGIAYPPHMTTYGAGCGYHRNFIIENCDFGYGIGIHTQGGFKSGHTILMNNCIGHNFRIGDSASADSDAVNDVIVNNCEFDVIQIAHANALTVPHIRLMGTGNEKSIIMCLPTDIYQINTVKTTAGYTVGQAVGKTSGSAVYGAYQVVTSIPLIYGIVVFVDSDFSYIQRTGYIASNVLGLTGLSMGDYVTIDSNGNVITGGTSENAIGVVKWVDADGYAYIKLMI
jgi:hypothetical protein